MTDAPGWTIHLHDRVGSTMDVAARLATFGAPERTVVISTEQTAGRGRAGRSWQAPPGSSLFCTLILRPRVPPDRITTLPLVTGVAVAEAIETLTGAPVQLKWPNDVWIGTDPERRKVAGILAASAVRGGAIDYVLVGIGVNVAGEAVALPPGATTLQSAAGTLLTANELLVSLLSQFDEAYKSFVTANGQPSLDGWRSRAALLDETVTIEDSSGAQCGVLEGIDDDGALLLRRAEHDVIRIIAGDLTRGPSALLDEPRDRSSQ